MTTALYSGSFDPPTFGHADIIRRGARLFGRVVIAVGVHHAKKALFSADERIAMLEDIVHGVRRTTAGQIDVTTFDGLVVDAARKAGATAILRGLRNVTDLDYEDQMAGMNSAMAPELETVFLASSGPVRHISSSLVRQVAALGGDLAPFVPPAIAVRLRAKTAAGQ